MSMSGLIESVRKLTKELTELERKLEEMAEQEKAEAAGSKA